MGSGVGWGNGTFSADFHPPRKDFQNTVTAASFPVVLGDFGCDVTRQACRESSPRTPRAIALGSKPPLVTRIERTGLGTRLQLQKQIEKKKVFNDEFIRV